MHSSEGAAPAAKTIMYDRRTILAGVAAGALIGASPAASAQVATPPMGIRRGTTLVRGRTIVWRAETGETPMRDPAGRVEATIFSVAYLADVPDPASRPVTFIWNGGPGSATWHLREDLSPRITKPASIPPNYAFVDNLQSIIDASDLVFIDAPGMGFSRLLLPSAKARYHGIEEDGRAFTAFIAGWLKSHGRSTSPIYLMGESYGGTRAGQVVRGLSEQQIPPAGVILISPTLGEDEAADERSLAPLRIPAQACVAWYHKRGRYIDLSLDRVAAAAEAFAGGPFSAAMTAPAALDRPGKRALAEQVSGFIGIPTDEILRSNLLVPLERFSQLLLADKNLNVDIYDGRETEAKPRPGAPQSALTPDLGFDRTASIEALIRDDLGYRAIGAYARDPALTDPWNNKLTRTASTDAILRDEMRRNATFRVLLVAGYFDTIVPYSQPLTALRAALPDQRFTAKIYGVGHAVYGDEKLRATTTAELTAWYADAAP